jgi:hypothetical protein
VNQVKELKYESTTAISTSSDLVSSLEIEREGHLATQSKLDSLQSKMTELKGKFDSVDDQSKEIEVCCEININKIDFSESS